MASGREEQIFQPVNNDNLYVGIVNQITSSILAGDLRPGDQLPTENELAKEFGVSRTVVREAIKALSLQGLVQVTTRRGTVITRPPIATVTNSLQILLKFDDNALDDLMVARLILEVPIARLAAIHAKAENVERLGLLLDGMRATLGDPEEFIRCDMAFHAELAAATQVPVLAMLLRPITETISARRRTLARVDGETGRAVQAHEQIYQAIKGNEPDAAEAAMRLHLAVVAQDTARAQEAVSGMGRVELGE